MKNLTIKALLVAAGLSLAACNSITNPFTNQPITAADVQQAAVQACGFLPTASTVASILTAGNPAVDTAASIASAIC